MKQSFKKQFPSRSLGTRERLFLMLLDKVQKGEEPDDWKPFSTVGAGVKEIRIREDKNIFRIMYVAKFRDTVYVLHAFQKKTQKTSRKDIETARNRYNDIAGRK
ncbi:MAG: type II toxin-antitoxin system RelE/ParE family toxin [Candidatus Electrothrix sp. EH2]|nr:type II toxin-antitoxin system RelE/ParE family toxin [Candidatus Electrothrix sp. EH2]